MAEVPVSRGEKPLPSPKERERGGRLLKPRTGFMRHLVNEWIPSRSERTKEWFSRKLLTLPDGKELEVVDTADESLVVPVTNDGQVLLVQRKSKALGTDIITSLTAANPESSDSGQIAQKALGKLDFSRDITVSLASTGELNPWKYLTSTTACFRADVDKDAAELAEHISITDPQTRDYLLLSENDFLKKVDTGEISDLRTIVGVQFALAAWKERSGASSSRTEFTVDKGIKALVEQPLEVRGSRIIDTPLDGEDFFSRGQVEGETVLQNRDHQAQVIPVVYDAGGNPESVILFVEPFFAQGKHSLSLPSGSIKDGDERKTVYEEAAEEMGYELDANKIRSVAGSRYPFPLYSPVASSVYEAPVIGKIDETTEKVRAVALRRDESKAERGHPVIVGVNDIGEYIRNGYITDASVLAGLLDWGRTNGIKIF
ncbi:MAG TPA: hypothetical protein VLF20_05075 [Patescibacteria group bacterium]|nr:hypothetical protein [Patescibacteria group bacterium]